MGELNLIHMSGLLVGGLALFLFGLQLMTDGLKAMAGARLQDVLGKLSANRFRGLLAGAAVTALLNSSTITTVLMVGFVSAGLMTLAQTVPMIMGANIGSTFTAQLIAFDMSVLTPFMLALGFLAHAFARREQLRRLGGILLGFGLLFLGIQFMGDATRPLRTFQPFIDAMQEMRSPLVGVAVGAIFTAVVQSSAATLAIIIALGAQGLMPLESGIALILGANVGTCGTALLAAIGKPPEALQVGIVHLLFNVFGVLLLIFIIPQYADFVRHISPSAPELSGVARLAAETPRQVANAHTVFSVASALALIWFTGPLARLAQRLAPSRPQPPKPDFSPIYLDDEALLAPGLAIERARLELARYGGQVAVLARRGGTVAVEGELDDIAALLESDKDAERLGAAILSYIGRATQEEHSERDAERMLDLAQIAASLDAVSDIARTNLVSATKRRLEGGADLVHLRDETTSRFAEAVFAGLDEAVALIAEPDEERAERLIEAKAKLDDLAAAARRGVLQKARLDDDADVLNFRLANELIEQLKEISRLSRAVARFVKGL